MFARILMTVILISAGGQLVSAGVIVSHEVGLDIPAERVFSMSLADEQDGTTYVRGGDSDDQASGFVVNANSSGLVSLLATGRPLDFPELSRGTIQLWNACLPRSPCLDELLKPA